MTASNIVKKKSVAIIGGGVSGLAAAKAFAERGHAVSGFERSNDFGGVWESARSYPEIQTQSPKDMYCYTDHPMPENYPEFPTAPQVRAYLHSYAEKHNLVSLFSLNTTVLQMGRRNRLEGWSLTLMNKAGRRWTEDFDFVVVCSGVFSDKKIVVHPGQGDFIKSGGSVMHSSEYNDVAVTKGRNVVVLGGSKSATDIAVSAAKNGAKSVTWVHHKPLWRVPYFLVGLINLKYLLPIRFQEAQFRGWSRSPLRRFIDALLAPVIWASFRGLAMLLRIQLKFNGWEVPHSPIEEQVSTLIPVATPGMKECLKNGSIKPYEGSIKYYKDHHAVLTNGEVVPCDTSILAVGWERGISFLPDDCRSKLIDSDGLYRLYRFAVNPDLPGIGFVGFNYTFCSMLSSELIANWLVRFADGKLSKQPTQDQMTDNIEMMLAWKRNERPAAKDCDGLVVAPFQYKHFDELLADIGAKKRTRTNPLEEYFSYPKAQAFGAFLASAPQYQAVED